jgi:hypothetical protein
MIKLFIEGKEVELFGGEEIVISKAANDLLDFESRQGDYSNTFKVPKTNKNKAIFENPHILTSQTRSPYVRLSAKLSAGGVDFNGFAILKTSHEDYEILFTSGNADFFQSIEGKKIKDLDFSEYNHAWNRTEITARRTANRGIVYPIADYHTDSPNSYINTGQRKVDVRTIYPCIYLKSILSKIEAQSGFRFTGDLFNITEFNDLIFPLFDFKKENPEPFKSNRQTRLTADSFFSSNLVSSPEVLLPFSVDFDPLSFYNIADKYYLPSGLSFAATVTVTFTIQNTRTGFGGQPGKLFFYKSLPDGTMEVLIGEEEVDIGETKTFSFSDDFDYKQGFSVNKYYVKCKAPTGSANGLRVRGFLNIENVDNSFQFGHTININNAIPDLSQSDFIKMIFARYNIVPVTEGRLIDCRLFKNIVSNKSNAEDWTHLVDYSESPKVSFSAEAFAQTNSLTYKKDTSVPEGLGNSFFEIRNENLTPFKDAITLPVSYSETVSMCGGVNMAKVKRLTEGAEKEKTELRLLVISKEKVTRKGAITITVNYLQEPFNFFIGTPAAFGGSISSDLTLTGFTAALPPLSFNNLKVDYYSELSQMLVNYKEVELLVKLSHGAVRTMDFTKPVFIRHNEVGGYYYKAEIMQHKLSSNESCYVRLIKI